MDVLTESVLEEDAEFGIAGIVGETAGTIASSWPGTAAPTFYQRRGKRLLDIVLGTVLLIVFLPIMAVSALAVLVVSGWPIFYRHGRLGRYSRPFGMLKFRTMVRNADAVLSELLRTNPALADEYCTSLKLRHDPRRTRVGIILRKLSIDELPQLWHVITGEMSLVGPRPYAVGEIELLSGRPEILMVTPAVTGPWQVRGRSSLSSKTRIALDAQYVSDITLAGDLRYLVATLKCLACANGH
jgi:lipopolysaccharide/colanic/teichoic acid biosynthesis glycosyltransferase